MKTSSLAAVFGALLLAGGCTGLLESDRGPVRVYTLSPPGEAAAHDPAAVTVSLAAVTSAPGLDTERMLLRREALRLDHFAAARWAAATPALVEDYFEAALLAGNAPLRLADAAEAPAYELAVDVRSFEADYRGGEPPVVRVAVVAALRDEGDRRRILLVTRSAAERSADNTLGSVAQAFDAAMAEVASRVLQDVETAIANGRD